MSAGERLILRHLVLLAWACACTGEKPAPLLLYAAAGGDGTVCSLKAPCSLAGARARVRAAAPAMSSDLTVYLRDGRYELAETMELGPADSGQNGFTVSWQAFPGERPLLTGGRIVTGWVLADPARGIFRAPAAGLHTRQLWVNGERAVRARGPRDPAGYTHTERGFTNPLSDSAGWGNPSDIELVGLVRWKAYRCPVARITPAELEAVQPCWANANLHAARPFDHLSWIENALELLDEPGEWYLDRAAGQLYYKPLPGTDMATATVVAPVLEVLVRLSGTSAQPVENLAFVGLTFSHATWLGPSSPSGYAVVQSGFHLVGSPPSWAVLEDMPDGAGYLEKTPGNVQVQGGRRVRFERNTFTALGAAGISVDGASADVTIAGNLFRDVSGSGIQIGDVSQHRDEAAVARRIRVTGNRLAGAAAEHLDGAGIFVGYAIDSVISHNDVRDLPWSGIAVGWGWDRSGDSVARDNEISHNRIADYLRTLVDGGGIYLVGSQPGSRIHDNHLVRQTDPVGAALYLDEGSTRCEVDHNVISAVPRWLLIWTSSIHDNTIHHNWTDSPDVVDDGLNNSITDTVLVSDGNWPPEAAAVIQRAGVEGGGRPPD